MAYLGRTELKSSDIQLKASVTISGSSTNTVVLAWTAPNEQSLILKVNGVVQHTDAYSIAGSPTTITLASGNFADAAVVEVVGINDIGKAIVPADGSVSRPKLATTGTPDGSKFLQDDMAWTAIAASGGYNDVYSTVADVTYTVPDDITKLLVIITGGGGGGAGGSSALGPTGVGGSGGTTVMARVTVVAEDTITIVIGAGGNGGGAATVGTVGGDSTFTWASGGGSASMSPITAPGGQEGKYEAATDALVAGTVGSNNQGISILGGYSGRGYSQSSVPGGPSFWGGGGQGGLEGDQVAVAGTAYGSGGGGGSNSAAHEAGAGGAVGVCFIMEFK